MFPSKRKVCQWKRSDEVTLLRETASMRPVSQKDWEEVAKHFIASFPDPACRPAVTGRSVKDHINLLIKHFHTEDREALKRSGTEEEYDELCQLCQDLSDYYRDVSEKENKRKEVVVGQKRKADEDNAKGLEMREAAMLTLKEKKGEQSTKNKKSRSSFGDFAALVQSNQVTKEKQLEIESRRLDLQQKQLEMQEKQMNLQFQLIQSLISKTNEHNKD